MLFLCQYFMLFLWYFYVLCFYISPRHHVMVYFYGIPYSPYLYGVPHISIAFPQFLWYALYVYIPRFPSPPCETPCETGHGRQWGRHAGCPHHVDGRWRGDLSDGRWPGETPLWWRFFHRQNMGKSSWNYGKIWKSEIPIHWIWRYTIFRQTLQPPLCVAWNHLKPNSAWCF